MAYRVHMLLEVDGDSGFCVVEQELALPFPPFPGLRIRLQNQGDEGELLELVTWEQPNQRFVALCPLWHDKPFPFEAQLQMLAYHGWTVKESSLRWYNSRNAQPELPGSNGRRQRTLRSGARQKNSPSSVSAVSDAAAPPTDRLNPVKLYVAVSAADGGAHLENEIELPFGPFPKLLIALSHQLSWVSCRNARIS